MLLREGVAMALVTTASALAACDDAGTDDEAGLGNNGADDSGPAGAGSCSDGGSCGEGYFCYTDKQCGLPVEDAGQSSCTEVGDLKCHKRCQSDSDCEDENAKHCVLQGLNAGGDFICNDTARICLSNTDVYECE